MEDWSCGYAMQEEGLVVRSPCNLAAFSARRSLSSKDPEPPWKPSNLSPKPSPNGAVHRRRLGGLIPKERRLSVGATWRAQRERRGRQAAGTPLESLVVSERGYNAEAVRIESQ